MTWFDKRKKDKDAVVVDVAMMEDVEKAVRSVGDFGGDTYLNEALDSSDAEREKVVALSAAVAAANDAADARDAAKAAAVKAEEAAKTAEAATAEAELIAEQADPEADVDEIMRKYDRESNTRIWEGTPKKIINILMALFSVYCIGMTLFSTELPETKLARFLACVVIIGYLMYPVRKGKVVVRHRHHGRRSGLLLVLRVHRSRNHQAFDAHPAHTCCCRHNRHACVNGAVSKVRRHSHSGSCNMPAHLRIDEPVRCVGRYVSHVA